MGSDERGVAALSLATALSFGQLASSQVCMWLLLRDQVLTLRDSRFPLRVEL